jgi:hypothetical protein
MRILVARIMFKSHLCQLLLIFSFARLVGALAQPRGNDSDLGNIDKIIIKLKLLLATLSQNNDNKTKNLSDNSKN